MKISLDWLSNYISGDAFRNSEFARPQSLASLLTFCGLEVESVQQFQSIEGGLEGLIIGEVLEVQKHPNADKLSLAKVNTGANVLSIVCGAPNVAAGQKVVVAPVGTIVHPFGKASFEIKKAKIRGELSEGMICAEDEIGLGTSHDGIMILREDALPGMSAKSYFNISEDTVFEIGLTPNRADAASHMGVARDVCAVLNTNPGKNFKLAIPPVENFKAPDRQNSIHVQIENTKDCTRYSGISMEGIVVRESPEWLQQRLKSIGQKPVNNVVDITNFVLHETGQPLHAFDREKISSGKVVVKNLPAGTSFLTLDGIQRVLNGTELMICNGDIPLCMAGVFGGLDSGVTESTTSVFLESACFHPSSVRKTSKHHGLKTDASFRFERGTDPEMTVYALKRTALLIEEICGGKISSPVIDIYPEPVKPAVIHYDLEKAARFMGMNIPYEIVKKILSDLSIRIVSETGHSLELQIPTFKTDVKRPADITEEVMRIYGYHHVPVPAKMNMPLPTGDTNIIEKLLPQLTGYLSANGYFEIFSNSLVKTEFPENDSTGETAVSLLNPLSTELNRLRDTMIYSGLEAIRYNRNRQRHNLCLFEWGKTYHHSNGGFLEIPHLAIFSTGARHEQSWIRQEPQHFSLHYFKSLMTNLLEQAGIHQQKLSFMSCRHPFADTAVEVKADDQPVAVYGLINKKTAASYDVNAEIYFGDILVNNLIPFFNNQQASFRELPRFPEVRRDLSMLIPENIAYGKIESLAFQTEKKLLRKVNLFDIYTNEKMEPGKISYAISFILRDDENTLEEKQIDGVMNKLADAFEKQLGARVRK